jgi:hypothetical protein
MGNTSGKTAILSVSAKTRPQALWAHSGASRRKAGTGLAVLKSQPFLIGRQRGEHRPIIFAPILY